MGSTVLEVTYLLKSAVVADHAAESVGLSVSDLSFIKAIQFVWFVEKALVYTAVAGELVPVLSSRLQEDALSCLRLHVPYS